MSLLVPRGRLCLSYLRVQYVMISLRTSVPICFAGTEDPAGYAELISIGGLNPSTNKKLSSSISEVLQAKLGVPPSRLYIKFYDVAVRINCTTCKCFVSFSPLSCSIFLGLSSPQSHSTVHVLFAAPQSATFRSFLFTRFSPIMLTCDNVTASFLTEFPTEK